MLGLRAQQEKRGKAQLDCGFGEGLERLPSAVQKNGVTMQNMVISTNLNRVPLLKQWDLNA